MCIPGGSYNARYFDVPGHSFAQAAADRGFPLAALNRPGYEDSTPLPAPTFAANAAAITRATGGLRAQAGAGYPGVVLVGHSMGGAVAAHIASRLRTWPLLGIAISSIHYDAPQAVTQAWNPMPADISIEFSQQQRVQFMYGRRAPTNRRSSRPPPSRPHRSPWPNCSKSSAAGPANVGDFAAAFTASPDVSARHLAGAGHNIDHHLAGRQYRADVLDWAVELAAR